MNVVKKSKMLKIKFLILPFLLIVGLYFALMQFFSYRAFGVCCVSLFTILLYYFCRFLCFSNFPDLGNFAAPDEVLRYCFYFENESFEIVSMSKYNAARFVELIQILEQNLYPFNMYSDLIFVIFGAAAVSVIVYFFAVKNYTIDEDDKLIRGSYLVPPEKLCALTEKEKDLAVGIKVRRKRGNWLSETINELLGTKTGLYLYLTRQQVLRHLLIIGGTGMGKSVLLCQLLPQLMHQNKNVKCVILDGKGEFIQSFYHPERGDKIYNPYDERSVGYNFFEDLATLVDHHIRTETEPPAVRNIANILADVATHEASHDNNLWCYAGAANIFYSVIMWCIVNHKANMRDFIRVCRESDDEIKKRIGTLPQVFRAPAEGEFSNAPESLASVMSTLRQQVSRFSATLESDGDFSIKKFMTEPGNLFLSRAGTMSKNFDALYKLIIDSFCMQIRGQADSGGEMKYLLFIDEFGELPVIDDLPNTLQLVRSKGGCVVLTNQTISKIRQKYGDGETANMLGNIHSRFYFRVVESKEAEYISKDLGSAEVERTSTGDNTSSGGGFAKGDRIGTSEQQSITKKQAVMPETLSNLPIGKCVADLKGLMSGDCHPVAILPIKMVRYKQRHEAFIDKYADIEAEAARRMSEDEKQEPAAASDPIPELETAPNNEQEDLSTQKFRVH